MSSGTNLSSSLWKPEMRPSAVSLPLLTSLKVAATRNRPTYRRGKPKGSDPAVTPRRAVCRLGNSPSCEARGCYLTGPPCSSCCGRARERPRRSPRRSAAEGPESRRGRCQPCAPGPRSPCTGGSCGSGARPRSRSCVQGYLQRAARRGRSGLKPSGFSLARIRVPSCTLAQGHCLSERGSFPNTCK